MNERGLLSRVPTLNKLKELESSGKIIVQKGKNNRKGQAHFLAINNKSAYNRIYNWLTEVENILNKIELEGPFEHIYYYICGPAPGDPNDLQELNRKRSQVLSNFLYACHRPIERLLDFLFILSNRVIQSEKDSQLLNEKIVDLYLKLMEVFNLKSTLKDIDFYLKEDISELDHCLKDAELNDYIRGIEINPNFARNLSQKMETFRTEIMEDFSQI